MTQGPVDVRKYLSVLESAPETFMTLDDSGFDGLASDPGCFSVRSSGLMTHVFGAIPVLTEVRPAWVRAGRQVFDTPLAPLPDSAGVLLRNVPEECVLSAGQSVLVSFLLFDSSYCFRSAVVNSGGGKAVLAWPDRLVLRRRRRQDRLVLANPISARIDAPGAVLTAQLRDLGEMGACLLLPADSPGPGVGSHHLHVDLPSGPLDAVFSVRWTEVVGSRRFLGVEFSTLTGEVRRNLAQRRRVARQELPTPLPCRLVLRSGLVCDAEVRDLTELGARIWAASAPITARDWIPEIRIRLDDGDVTVTAEIRWTSTADGGVSAGLQFSTMDADVRDSLLAFLIPHMRPNVGEARLSDLDQVMALYDEVNYFGETGKGEKARAVLGEALEVWSTLLGRGRHLGAMVVVREGNRILGVCESSRLYSHTWLTHSMAATRGSALIATEHLRLGQLEQMERESTTEYLQAYFLKSKAFSQRYYQAVVAATPRPDLHHISVVNVIDYEFRNLQIGSLPDARIRLAGPSDSPGFLTALQRVFPDLYLRSVDLADGQWSIDELGREFTSLGLVRDRRLLVQEDATGRPVAYALLEITSPGLTLNGCTDGFWLFPADPTPGPVSWQPLVAECLRFFCDLGRARTNYFSHDTDPTPFLWPGSTFIPELCIWTAHVDAASDIRRHFQTVYGTYKLEKLARAGVTPPGG